MTPESKGLPRSNLAVNLAEDRPETAKFFLSNSELESATLSSCVSAQVSYCVMAMNADRSSTSGAPAAERCHRDSKANKQQLGFHCDPPQLLATVVDVFWPAAAPCGWLRSLR